MEIWTWSESASRLLGGVEASESEKNVYRICTLVGYAILTSNRRLCHAGGVECARVIRSEL